jgi:hypothetical protein
MMRKLILTALLALAVPAGALAADLAPSPDDLAQAACKSEKAPGLDHGLELRASARSRFGCSHFEG